MKLRNLCLVASLGIPIAVANSQSANHNPGLALQGPDHYSFTVGDVLITASPETGNRLPEGTGTHPKPVPIRRKCPTPGKEKWGMATSVRLSANMESA